MSAGFDIERTRVDAPADAGIQAADTQAPGPVRHRPGLRLAKDFLSQPPALLSTLWITTLMLVTVYVKVFDAIDPNSQDLANRLAGPSWDHPLGLDNLGRDTFDRMLSATPVAMWAIVQGTLLAVALGVVPGLIAGFKRGWIDRALTRVADIFIVIPGLVVALAILGALGPSLTNAMIAVGVLLAPPMFRVVRGAVLGIRESEYVDGARVMGVSNSRIVMRHILPNVLSPVLVQIALTAAAVLLAEASLSFLGLGVQPPQASWGSMIRDGQRYMNQQPLLGVWPGIAITMAAVSFNLIADGLSKAIARRGGVTQDD